jgi:hypothetical protein
MKEGLGQSPPVDPDFRHPDDPDTHAMVRPQVQIDLSVIHTLSCLVPVSRVGQTEVVFPFVVILVFGVPVSLIAVATVFVVLMDVDVFAQDVSRHTDGCKGSSVRVFIVRRKGDVGVGVPVLRFEGQHQDRIS